MLCCPKEVSMRHKLMLRTLCRQSIMENVGIVAKRAFLDDIHISFVSMNII